MNRRPAWSAAPDDGPLTATPQPRRGLVRLALQAALCAGLLAALPLPAASAAESLLRPYRGAQADDAPRVIVRFKADSQAVRAMSASGRGTLRQAQVLSLRHGVALSDGRTLDSRTQLVFGAGRSGGRALAQLLARDPQVEYAEVDRRVSARGVPNDPLYPDNLAGVTPAVGQWYLRRPDATFVSAINAEEAWDVTIGDANLVVAVLDTGVRPDHPDLAGKLLAGYDFVSDAATGNDGDGWDGDPSDPGDWISATEANDPSSQFYGGEGCSTMDDTTGQYSSVASSWHGTQTAGLVGAVTNNALGMASVGRNVKVLPVRVLGKCGGYMSDVVTAMRWAAGLNVPGVADNPVANRARVVNLSLGAAGTCGTLFQDTVTTLTSLGVTVVVAAGNGNGYAVDAPGNCTGAITVAGLRHAGTKVGYSNVGPEVTLGAPAGNCVNTSGPCLHPIISTANSGTQGPVSATYTSGGSDAGLGTSFSAPLVSGTVALMRSANPALTVADVRTILQRTARPYPTTGGGADALACRAPDGTEQLECYCTTSTCGAGMLDAKAALQVIAQAQVLVSVTAPASAPVAGQAYTLSASALAAGAGRSIASLQWTVANGTASALITGSAVMDSVTVVPQGAGTFTVVFTATDSLGQMASQSVVLTASAPTGGSGGSSGGGALGPGALLVLAAAAAVLRPRRRPAAR